MQRTALWELKYMKINFDHVKQPNIENLKPGKGISEKQIRETNGTLLNLILLEHLHLTIH